MPRPRNPNSKRWTGDFNEGYVECVNGLAVLRYNGLRRSTGGKKGSRNLPFIPEHEETCKKLLNAWVFSIKYPNKPNPYIEEEEKPKAPVGITLIRAIDEFREARFKDMSYANQQNFERAFKYFILQDCVLDYDTVYNQLKKVKAKSDLELNTLNKYLGNLSLFFDFVVESGWLEKNPIAKLGKPKRQEKNEIIIPLPEHVEKMVSELWKKKHLREYALWIQFLSLSAMRFGESLDLMKSDVTDREIRVMGKGKGKGKVVRRVPVQKIPGLAETIKKLRALPRPDGTRLHGSAADKFFRWTNQTLPRNVFNDIKEELGFGVIGDGFTVHSLRAYALWLWEFELGWDEKSIDDAAGNTDDIRKKHYRKLPSIPDMEKKLEKQKKGARQ